MKYYFLLSIIFVQLVLIFFMSDCLRQDVVSLRQDVVSLRKDVVSLHLGLRNIQMVENM